MPAVRGRRPAVRQQLGVVAVVTSLGRNSSTAQVERDVPGAVLAWAFVVLLFGSEAALNLPDENAGASAVASFYAHHRTAVVVLQLIGLIAAGLLAGYAARLRRFDAAAGTAGIVTAVLACAPAVVTLVIALVADPAHPSTAGTWNVREPRADDALFVGITLFGAVIASRPRFPAVARVLAAIVAVLCGARLVLEATGHARGAFDSLGPISFLLLMAVLGCLSAVGRLGTGRGPRRVR